MKLPQKFIWVKEVAFDWQGYKVVKLTDIERHLSELNYELFLASLEGSTLCVGEDGETLVFYTDIYNFLIT